MLQYRYVFFGAVSYISVYSRIVFVAGFECLLSPLSLYQGKKAYKNQNRFYLLFEQEIQLWPELVVSKVVIQCTLTFTPTN